MNKRILSLVLALVMVLGTFGTVFAAEFNDVTGSDFESAVERLDLLGILEGYPDGTFKPANSITRAEFAAVAARAKGLEAVAQAAKGLPTGFTDVPGTHWASGYVGTAARLTIVKGIGNGQFAPEAPVKYEEAVTMMVRALGYEEAAQAKGGYPYGYLIVANEIDLLDGVKGTQGVAATRGLVAQLTDNALEIPMMIQVGFGTDTKWVVSGKENTDKVYLLNGLGVEEIEGTVVANFRLNSKLDADEITIDKDNYTVAENIDVDAILGLEVTAWEKDDVIFAITVETSEENILLDTVSAVSEADIKLLIKNDTFKYAKDAKVYVNNEKETDFEDVALKSYGKVVLNDDEEVIFAYLFDFAKGDIGVVTEVEDDIIAFTSSVDFTDQEIDLTDADEFYVFNKDFSLAKAENIVEDSAIFFWVESDEYHVIVLNDIIEGTLERVRDDKRVVVEGTTYRTSYLSGSLFTDDGTTEYNEYTTYDKLDNLSGDKAEVELVMDLNGRVLLVRGDSEATSAKQYGIVTYATSGRNPEVTVFNGSDAEVEYAVEKRTDYDGISAYDYLGTDAGTLEYAIISYKLNKDAKIKAPIDLVTVSYAAGIATADVYGYTLGKDADKTYVTTTEGRFYIGESTVVMTALNSDGELDPEVIDNKDLVKYALSGKKAVILGEVGKTANMIVFTEKGLGFANDDYLYGIVSGKTFRDGADYVAEMDVNGKGVAEYTFEDRTDFPQNSLVKFYLDKDDYAVNSTVSADLVTGATVSNIDGNYFEVSGDVYKVASNVVVYALDKDAVLSKVRYSRLKNADEVSFIVDADDVVVAILITTEDTTGGATYSKLVSGKTYQGTFETADIFNGTAKLTASTIKVKGTDGSYTDVTPDPESVVLKVISSTKYYEGTTVFTGEEVLVNLDPGLVTFQIDSNGNLTTIVK